MARHLITSALPSINGVPHLGKLVGSMLPADVYARYLRLRGHGVLFVCATDEHGTQVELAARDAGLDVEEHCRRQHERQAYIYWRFALSFDHFGRSSSRQNAELTQYFARCLEANGFVEERATRQIYSIEGAYLPDRFVGGYCPHCGSHWARSDHCDDCGRLFDPSELVRPWSPLAVGIRLDVRTGRHLVVTQVKLADELRRWIATKQDWPALVTSIARKWLDEGLGDRGITRDLGRGVPVGRHGFENKVFSVSFDAPVTYIAATKEWAEADPSQRDWRSWWYATDDVRYTQFVAREDIGLHAISFPGCVRGTREPWKLVDFIKAFHELKYCGGDFSQEQGIGVFLDDALELLPADCWRWYLLANAPEKHDSVFTWPRLARAVNKDLADNLGNFVHRTLTLTERRFGSGRPVGRQPG